jgi:hypothetical protein
MRRMARLVCWQWPDLTALDYNSAWRWDETLSESIPCDWSVGSK